LRNLRFSGLSRTILVALGLSLTSSAALANGRYPLAQQLLVDPQDPAHLFLRSTYGVLTTSDAGTTWSWLCEAGIGYDSGEDPMMAILGDGSVLAGASTGLFVTRDGGCSWPKDATLGDRFVRDLAAESDGSGVLAVTVVVRNDGHYDAGLWRSPDRAGTWTSLGNVTAESVLPFTLDPAPSDSRRIYVTGAVLPAMGDAGAASSGDGPGALFRSRDGGATWERRPIPGTSRQSAPYIAKVDPKDPDGLYVRVRGEWNGTDPVQSWLLYSNDGGNTWRELFRAKADMLGFAIAPDGSVLVGMGDTRDIMRPVDTTVLGVYRGSPPDFAFSRSFEGQVGCLTYSGSSLYVCGGQERDGFELGVSTDGATFAPVFRYGTVEGPLACAADTPQAMQCTSQWVFACRGLGKCPHVDAGAEPSAGPAGSSGCCGSARPAPDEPKTGTARLDMLPGPDGGWLATGAIGVGLLRRLLRRLRRGERH
jgi:photosystem II stability/assembly factor-like uncharacterized protein